MNSMLENLNNEQRAAVETTNGPVLVLSGAGTGKTRVLTTRVAYILNQGLALPWQILALTFTNKAANEMKSRIASLAESGGGWDARDLWCGTFHSICLRILRANYAAAGLRKDFIIFGEDDQKAVVKNVLNDMGITTRTPGDFVEQFSSIKDKGLSAFDNDDKYYAAYNTELARMGAIDFGDIILYVLRLFNTQPEILARYQRQFKYILVDEFQDTNAAQMQLLEMLTRGVTIPNICCVGDDDQSIYSWRGAEIKNILNFEKTFPGTTIIRLETNYRSTQNILGAANSLIRHNNGRLGKDLRSVKSDVSGEPVYVLTLPSDLDEVRVISDAISRDRNDFSNCAILIRAGNLSRLFEEEFTRRGIPYRLVGATKFYDRMEVRDVIAYLRLLVYPFDDISFMRIIGKPRRGFGPTAIDKLRSTGPNLMAGLRTATLSTKQRVAADEFLNAFNFNWMEMKPRDAAQTLLERSGYIQMWRDSKEGDSPDRLENIRELITSVVSKYDTLPEFLEQAALMTTDDDEADRIDDGKNVVSIMTIHAAKGLEFDNVFLPAWEENIFPNEKSIKEDGIEEERRLAYVAITRARRRAVISNAMTRVMFGSRQYNSPSRFITEMDNRFVDFQGGTPRGYSQSYHTPKQPQKHTDIQTMVGKLVSHDELGRGTVIAENGEVLTVAFGNRGIKNVMKSYVTVL